MIIIINNKHNNKIIQIYKPKFDNIGLIIINYLKMNFYRLNATNYIIQSIR